MVVAKSAAKHTAAKPAHKAAKAAPKKATVAEAKKSRGGGEHHTHYALREFSSK